MVSLRDHQQTADNDRGATDIFMLMLLTTLLLFAGLAFDVGMLFNAHREATNVAAAAARSAANQVSTNALYNNGAAEIDEPKARTAVSNRVPSYMNTLDVDITPTEVFVKVEATHHPKILNAFGFGTFKIVGEATARVSNGAP